MKLKLYDVDFKPIRNLISHLFIYAENIIEARDIAKKTIKHTTEIGRIHLVKAEKGVMSYHDGDY